MNLQDIVHRAVPAAPWLEGEKIPWDDPDFSERMLREHLSQAHDLASRRREVIDRHVAWIHAACLEQKPSRVLDLGCGPGLYLQRLAGLGHTCVGIDFSPASIAYAKAQAARAGADIEYVQGDIRAAAFAPGFDLIMLVYGEFNVFRRDDAEKLLARMHAALKPGGKLILEPQTFDVIRADGRRPACWHSESAGLFSPKPHVWLEEHFWHEDIGAATTRYHIVDAASASVARYASTSQAYTEAELDHLLTQAGFHAIERFASLAGTDDDRQEGLFVVRALRPREG